MCRKILKAILAIQTQELEIQVNFWIIFFFYLNSCYWLVDTQKQIDLDNKISLDSLPKSRN